MMVSAEYSGVTYLVSNGITRFTQVGLIQHTTVRECGRIINIRIIGSVHTIIPSSDITYVVRLFGSPVPLCRIGIVVRESTGILQSADDIHIQLEQGVEIIQLR